MIFGKEGETQTRLVGYIGYVVVCLKDEFWK